MSTFGASLTCAFSSGTVTLSPCRSASCSGSRDSLSPNRPVLTLAHVGRPDASAQIWPMVPILSPVRSWTSRPTSVPTCSCVSMWGVSSRLHHLRGRSCFATRVTVSYPQPERLCLAHAPGSNRRSGTGRAQPPVHHEQLRQPRQNGRLPQQARIGVPGCEPALVRLRTTDAAAADTVGPSVRTRRPDG